ncbi:MAG TPA: hypothetical protein VF418_13185 [Sphingomonadaceae bacterium]
MLLMVEDASEKRAAQKALEASVRQHLTDQGVRNIGFPSGNVDERLYANGLGQLWAAFGTVEDAAIPRRWNAFGVFDPKRYAQIITVEVNIPTTSNSARVAGFFAREPVTGDVYLMHDGSIGGGKAGVGRSAFLSWSKATLEDVGRDDGDDRAGIIIGRVDSDDIAGRLWRFVQLVKGFKDAVARGNWMTRTCGGRLRNGRSSIARVLAADEDNGVRRSIISPIMATSSNGCSKSGKFSAQMTSGS